MLKDLKQIIIWEDEDFLVVNKPADLSSLDEHNNSKISLFSLVKKHHPEYRLCHRLDKNTSGCLILSKHNDAYRHAAMQFEKRVIKKYYHAVLEGQHQFDNREVKAALVKKQNNTAIWAQEGKPSLTYFTSIELFKNFTLCECQPITGRFHQIRVHAKYLKAPIAADTIYGGTIPYLSKIMYKYKERKDRIENPMMSRVALHAKSIEFNNMKGEGITVESDYPKDYMTFLKLLRKNNAITH